MRKIDYLCCFIVILTLISTGTGIFHSTGGDSFFVTGQQLSIAEIYTTEPTFVLDLGIILPVYWGCGIALIKKKEIGYKLTPVLLTFIAIVGATVIGQNIFQSYLGIEIPIQQFIGLVVSFIVLGIISIILNLRFLEAE